jgi:predicted homoserine dehydrogenase-like protein
MKLDMSPKLALTPAERLSQSRSEIVSYMQKDNQIFHILKPVVASYVKTHQVKTLGIAAGIGAAIVVLKPWRLITLESSIAVLRARK